MCYNLADMSDNYCYNSQCTDRTVAFNSGCHQGTSLVLLEIWRPLHTRSDCDTLCYCGLWLHCWKCSTSLKVTVLRRVLAIQKFGFNLRSEPGLCAQTSKQSPALILVPWFSCLSVEWIYNLYTPIQLFPWQLQALSVYLHLIPHRTVMTVNVAPSWLNKACTCS